MTDELTDDQIALLCAIEECDPSELAGERRGDLQRLLAEGYVEPTSAHPGTFLQLTAKGAAFLGERGAGLNEA